MNKFYTKLEASFENYDYTTFKGDLCYQYKGSTLAYYEINNEFKLRQILPKVLSKVGYFSIKIVEVTGKDYIPPHKDYGLDTSINFYFQPGKAKTFWYTEKFQAKENISHELKVRIYDLNDIVLSDSFTASVNECYLFNNSQIHSVLKYDDSTRQFLQFQYSISYETILEKLGAN